MKFDDAYREEVSLSDGTKVTLRLLRRGDADLLTEGFRRLSTHSKFLRFMGNKADLTEDELRYLTHVDGNMHFALGAVISDPVLVERGIGVARFVRASEGAQVAEPAVVVTDEFQQRGLGSLLLSRLAEAARERGIDTFRATFHEANAPLRSLLESQHVHIDQPEAGECTLLVSLGADANSRAGTSPDLTQAARDGVRTEPQNAKTAAGAQSGTTLGNLLRLAAEGVIALLRRPPKRIG